VLDLVDKDRSGSVTLSEVLGCICILVLVYVCMCVCVYVFMYVCMCKLANILTNTHTHKTHPQLIHVMNRGNIDLPGRTHIHVY
jgi:hypothetical protein